MYHSQAGPALKRQSSGDSAGLGHPHPSLSRGASLDSPKVTLGEQMVLLIITVFVIISLVILGPAQPRKFFRPGERESSSLSSGTNPQGDAQDLVVVHPLQSNPVQFLQGNPAQPILFKATLSVLLQGNTEDLFRGDRKKTDLPNDKIDLLAFVTPPLPPIPSSRRHLLQPKPRPHPLIKMFSLPFNRLSL